MKKVYIMVSGTGDGDGASADPPSIIASMLGSGDKKALADHFRTCVRTIEDWHARGLIAGTRKGRALWFDLSDCERRLGQLTSDSVGHPLLSPSQSALLGSDRPTEYATIAELAFRYSVSTRTIKNWKKAGLLPCFKIRRVLRFDVHACDKSLIEHGFDI